MKLTQLLKAWLVENECLSAPDASDEECRKAAAMALASDKLTTEKLVELTADPDAVKATGLETMLASLVETQKATMARIDALTAGHKQTVDAPDMPAGAAKAMADGKSDVAPKVDVKSVEKMYDTTRTVKRFPTEMTNGKKHPFAGQPVKEGTRTIDESSQLDQAVSGVFAKFMLGGKNPSRQFRLNDHEQQVLDYALHEMKWGGGEDKNGGIEVDRRKLSDLEIKAILDDATSGGLEITPIAFDDAIITIPLLYGELYPSVEVVPVARGRRMEGGSIGSITGAWGGVDGTAIPLFATASLISAFDTSIYVWNGSIELGLDFMSDSPIDIGANVTMQYGNELLKQLDDVIATGNGTTQPLGYTNAGGLTSVSSANGAGGPPTVGDYEGLLFGVSKPYRANTPATRNRFFGNETSYQRARGIAVGATDQRRVFGMTHEDYMLLGHPYAINESLTNAQVGFANLSRYRMYRRLGLNLRTSTEGKELIRANQMLVAVRARFGGQPTAGASAALSTDMQS